MFLFVDFSSETRASPIINTIMDKITTTYTIIGSCISANIVDSNNAVTIYLAMSISHLPNSFSCCKDKHYFHFLQIFMKKLWGPV